MFVNSCVLIFINYKLWLRASFHVYFSINRSHAIGCVNQFIVNRTQALMIHITTFIEVNIFPFVKKCCYEITATE